MVEAKEAKGIRRNYSGWICIFCYDDTNESSSCSGNADFSHIKLNLGYLIMNVPHLFDANSFIARPKPS